MKTYFSVAFVAVTFVFFSCKKGCTDPNATNYDKKIKHDDGSCVYAYPVPTTYIFTDKNGNSTVNYADQSNRIQQINELVTLLKSATSTVVQNQNLLDMFANTGGNGNGNFSFSSSVNLQDKCYAPDLNLLKSFLDSVSVASFFHDSTASNGKPGILAKTDSSSFYLFTAQGVEYAEVFKKAVIGAVLFYQATNQYLGSSGMSVDNSSVVSGTYYTAMEHQWDQAFGCFGVPINFPTSLPDDLWGKYANEANPSIACNSAMMDNFLKGRAAISNNDMTSRDAASKEIRITWEKIAAQKVIGELDEAKEAAGLDQAKFLHEISEAYGFALCLRYVPSETSIITQGQVNQLITDFGVNFWNISLTDVNGIISTVKGIYNFN